MKVSIGDPVVYVDSKSQNQPALVTAVWGSTETGEYGQWSEWKEGQMAPSVNVVFVSDDPSRKDEWIRQIERSTSVPHKTSQSAHGNYWVLK